MIFETRKFLLVGVHEDLEPFFDKAQEEGFIEFVPSRTGRMGPLPPEVRNLLSAIKILRKQPVRPPYQGIRESAIELASQILELRQRIQQLYEAQRKTQQEIARIAPFGDFALEDLRYIEQVGGRQIQFFCIKSAKAQRMQFPKELIYIGTEYDLDYFLAINPHTCTYPRMIEIHIPRPLSELKAHLLFLAQTLHELETEVKGYAGHIEWLREALVDQLNQFHLAFAKQQAAQPMEGSLFSVEAWVPQHRISHLYALIEPFAIEAQAIALEPSERQPTYIENGGMQRLGEDLVRVYDVPSPVDRDPSGWVIWCFALFFSMIVADAGYGAIYLGLSGLMAWRIRKKTTFQKRFIKLVALLAGFCIGWGVLTNAYFGIRIDPQSWLGRASLVDYLAAQKADYHIERQDGTYKEWVATRPGLKGTTSGRALMQQDPSLLVQTSREILLEFSLMVGVIHIVLSFLRNLRRSWAGLGWMGFLVGGYLYFPVLLGATSILHFTHVVTTSAGEQIGRELLLFGIGAALFLALVQKRLRGLTEVMNIVQIFADVLSYLRLYALGLAGAVLAETFNSLGGSLGFFFGLLIIIAGQGVNMLMGLISGVIHGLRLNFIEWYHYSFEGGGRWFSPLKRLQFRE